MKRIVFTFITILMATALVGADKKKSAEDYMKDLNPAKDEKLIVEAADYMGKQEEKDAVPKLIKLLNDSRENVRLHAVMALGYIGEESAVDSINKVLLNDSSSNVRYAAVLTTFRIGSKKSYDTIKKVKESESDPFIQDFLKKMEEKLKGK